MTSPFAVIAEAVAGSLELSLVLKAAVAGALGLLAAGLARHARASVRHLLLASTFAALLALPLVAALLPIVDIELAPARDLDPRSAVSAAVDTSGHSAPAAGVVGRPSAGTRPSVLTWPILLRVGWATGATALLASFALALWRLARIRRSGLPWLAKRDLVRTLAREAHVRRPVQLVLHENAAGPLTCGLLRPTIVLPFAAALWSEAEVRRALVHELEHVRRGDWAVQVAARATCALYWFLPLVWMAGRRLGIEAERACDDAVIEGSERTEYAAQLVALARGLRGAPAQPALSMASRSELAVRVSALLDEQQRRGRAGRWSAATAVIVASLVVLVIAPLRPVRAGEATAAARPKPAASLLDRALMQATEQGELGDMAKLLDAGADANAAVRGDGSPLIAAAREGSLAAVRFLLERGADPNLPVPGDGSPIIMAAREGHADVVELLLERGASIDQIVPEDENALIRASGAGHLEVVKLLVRRGADVNVRAWVEPALQRPHGEWRTPLGMARKNGHQEVVAFLRSAGAHE